MIVETVFKMFLKCGRGLHFSAFSFEQMLVRIPCGDVCYSQPSFLLNIITETQSFCLIFLIIIVS